MAIVVAFGALVGVVCMQGFNAPFALEDVTSLVLRISVAEITTVELCFCIL